MSSALPLLFALLPLGVSGVALVWLLRARPGDRSKLLLHVVASGSVAVFVFQAGPWVFTSTYLRFLTLALFVAGAIQLFRGRPETGTGRSTASIVGYVLPIAVVVLFITLSALTVAARYPSGEPVDLAFPLRDGAYAVLQGGSNVVANPFHALSGNSFPIDLVKLNRFGNRAAGIAPRELYGYEIFGDMLHSPCTGALRDARDGMPDNAPGNLDMLHTEGNYLRIACGDADVLMAHMKSGSLLVSPGQAVAAGQPVGQVGNSGNSMEPHLHIEASRDGRPVPMRFHGRTLVVNDVIRSGPSGPSG